MIKLELTEEDACVVFIAAEEAVESAAKEGISIGIPLRALKAISFQLGQQNFDALAFAKEKAAEYEKRTKERKK